MKQKFKFTRTIGMSDLSEFTKLVKAIQLTELITIYASELLFWREVQNLHRPYISDFSQISYPKIMTCHE